ncbi:MAG: NAD(P)-binding protein, partial [Propionicimonas sp.]
MIVVVGATLAGFAAAARLARVNHEVVVVEARASQPALLPSPLEDAITLPAAWRDLFRKTGRPLDAVLAARGISLSPAPGRILRDGLQLPADRGG